MANRDRPKKEFGGVFSRLQDVLAPTKLVVDKKTIEKSWKLMDKVVKYRQLPGGFPFSALQRLWFKSY
jgi:hypothetical protein